MAQRTADTAEVVDALVVGTGFGGSVSAWRLASSGLQVVVMERGRSYPPGSFARTPAEFSENFWSPDDGLFGLFETWSFRGIEGVVSSGLGGGSLIYANTLLRKDPEWFVHDEPIPGGGYETWPIGREDLDPHYDRVERMLGARPYPYEDTPKTIAFEAAARTAGFATARPPLAVSFSPPSPGRLPGYDPVPEPEYGNIHGARRLTCNLCGGCNIGCNIGAKNTMDHTYLSAAAHAGADIRTLHEVKGFHRDGALWEVRYRVHDPSAGVDSTGSAGSSRPVEDRVIRARRLVLAAGTFGSTHLVLKSKASLPGLSPAAGTRFCGNGDLIGFLLDAKQSIDAATGFRHLTSSRGPVITSAVRVGDVLDGTGATGRGFYVEDAGYPGFLNWLLEVAQVRSVVSRSTKTAVRLLSSRLVAGGRSNVSRDFASAIGKISLSSSSMPVLGMGRDIPDGRMYLDQGRLEIDWTTSTSLAYFASMRSAMERIAAAMDARYVDNPLWWAKRVITVHPLGGNPMGRNEHEGVVDGWGRMFGTDDLWIVDGSAMPGPVGPNPALTIAAFADRAMDRLLDKPARAVRPAAGASSEGSVALPARSVPIRSPEPVPRAGSSGTSVRFTEQMKGYVRLGAGEPRQAYEDARVRGQRFLFELTISTPGIEEFLADPEHRGTATGYVDAEVLGGRVPVTRAWFNLFVGGQRDRQMRYRLWLEPDSGESFTFVGFKDVHDDPGFDLWDDTTTLYVQLLVGLIPPDDSSGLLPADDPRVRGAGILHIKPIDFARQLTTFRAEGPDPGAAIARFGELFLGDLWGTYAGLAGPRS